MKTNNVIDFSDRGKPNKKTRMCSAARNGSKTDAEFFSATLAGDCYKHLGFFDGDFVIVEKDALVRHGDFGLIKYEGQQVVFRVYFDGDKVILHGEKIEIFERSKVEFVGRVIRMERDFN